LYIKGKKTKSLKKIANKKIKSIFLSIFTTDRCLSFVYYQFPQFLYSAKSAIKFYVPTLKYFIFTQTFFSIKIFDFRPNKKIYHKIETSPFGWKEKWKEIKKNKIKNKNKK
jgi:hypothetical protein